MRLYWKYLQASGYCVSRMVVIVTQLHITRCPLTLGGGDRRDLAARHGSAIRLLRGVFVDPLHQAALGTEYLGSSHGQFPLAVTLDAVHHLAL